MAGSRRESLPLGAAEPVLGQLHGWVWLQGPAGQRTAAGDGQLTALTWPSAKRSRLLEFDVRAGRFAGPWIESPSVQEVLWTFYDQRTDSLRWKAWAAPAGSPAASPWTPGDPPFELCFEPQPGVLLRVLDRVTRQPLPEVRLVPADSRALAAGFGPPEDAPLAAPIGPSPLALPVPESGALGKQRLWVCAPNYAAQRVEIDNALGGLHEALLERAGALRLWVDDQREVPAERDRPRPLCLLLIYDGDPGTQGDLDREALPVAGGGQPLEVTGLLPGAYRLALVEKLGSRIHPVSECESLRLATGECAHLRLQARTLPAPKPIAISGELQVPSEWERMGALELGGFELRLVAEGRTLTGERSGCRLESELDPSGVLRFDGQMEAPGVHWLELPWIGFEQRLVVPPEGLRGLSIAVPPPAGVHVRVLHPETGVALELEELTLETVRSETSTLPPGRQRLAFDPGTGQHFAWCPAGEILLAARGGDLFGIQSARRRVEPGQNQIELEAIPVQRLWIEVRTDAEPRPAPQGLRLVLEDGGSLTARGPFASRAYFDLFRAGRARLELPAIPGFAVPAPLDLEIPARDPAPITVRYQRLR